MARDVGVASRIGISFRHAARLDAIEKVADMEGGGVVADFRDLSAGLQVRRAEDHLAAVPRFDPARLPFEPDGARAEGNPVVFAKDQLDAILIPRH